VVDSQCAGKLRSRVGHAGKGNGVSVSLWLRQAVLRNSETLSGRIDLHPKAQRIPHNALMRKGSRGVSADYADWHRPE
jgi:hypothetical protein